MWGGVSRRAERPQKVGGHGAIRTLKSSLWFTVKKAPSVVFSMRMDVVFCGLLRSLGWDNTLKRNKTEGQRPKRCVSPDDIVLFQLRGSGTHLR